MKLKYEKAKIEVCTFDTESIMEASDVTEIPENAYRLYRLLNDRETVDI